MGKSPVHQQVDTGHIARIRADQEVERLVRRANIALARPGERAKENEMVEQVAALRGQATWDAQDGSIAYFRVEEILHHEKTKPSDAFQELRQAANGAYDQIEDIDLFAWRVREGELP